MSDSILVPSDVFGFALTSNSIIALLLFCVFDLRHLPSLSVGLGCLLSCYLPVVTLSAIFLLQSGLQ